MTTSLMMMAFFAVMLVIVLLHEGVLKVSKVILLFLITFVIAALILRKMGIRSTNSYFTVVSYGLWIGWDIGLFIYNVLAENIKK